MKKHIKSMAQLALVAGVMSISSSLFAGSASESGQVTTLPNDYGVSLGIYPPNSNPGTSTPGSGNPSSGVIVKAQNINVPGNPYAAKGTMTLSNAGTRGQDKATTWFFLRSDVTCLNIVTNQVDPNTGKSYDVAIVGGTVTSLVDGKGSAGPVGNQLYTLIRSDGKVLASSIFAAFTVPVPPGPCGFVDADFVLADLPGEFGFAGPALPLSIWSALATTVGNVKISP